MFELLLSGLVAALVVARAVRSLVSFSRNVKLLEEFNLDCDDITVVSRQEMWELQNSHDVKLGKRYVNQVRNQAVGSLAVVAIVGYIFLPLGIFIAFNVYKTFIELGVLRNLVGTINGMYVFNEQKMYVCGDVEQLTFITSIFHENQHHIQNLTMNKQLSDSVASAKMFGNYLGSWHEVDAREVAFNKTLEWYKSNKPYLIPFLYVAMRGLKTGR